MAIARRRRAELAKVLRTLMNDTTQIAAVRLRAAGRLQRLYESEVPAAPVNPPTPTDPRALEETIAKLKAVAGGA